MESSEDRNFRIRGYLYDLLEYEDHGGVAMGVCVRCGALDEDPGEHRECSECGSDGRRTAEFFLRRYSYLLPGDIRVLYGLEG